MTLLGWLAALVLFLQLPVPIYWLVLHPRVNFWRRHQKASLIAALLCSWPPVAVCVFVWRRELCRADFPHLWRVVAGIALIVFEGWLFWRLGHDLGAARLVGKTEMSGGGEIARHGIYSRVRHPRYAGSFLAIIGACLIAGTRVMWIVAAVWAALALIAISLEERELRERFGAAYEEYSRNVPRFVPLRTGPLH